MRKTFLSVSTNTEPTTMFVHVEQQPDGSAKSFLGYHSMSQNELVVGMTHSNPSFEAECREWETWSQEAVKP